MHTTTLELMHDHVRAIYRVLTGSDLPEKAQEPEPAPTGEAPPLDLVAQRFADLEMVARTIPLVAERVPPFSFAPPLDAIGTDKELIIEIAISGIERRDVDVELSDGLLVISGSRAGELPVDGRIYYHAEIPRGPFRRVVRLPHAVTGAPRVDVEQGLVRVRLTKATPATRAKA
jgi:HSP20 family molecular chaperone IbpA